jgi:hypothetical protein
MKNEKTKKIALLGMGGTIGILLIVLMFWILPATNSITTEPINNAATAQATAVISITGTSLFLPNPFQRVSPLRR